MRLDQLALTRRLRDRVTLLAETFYVKIDSLFDESYDFCPRLPNRNATGQIWHMCTPASATFFNND